MIGAISLIESLLVHEQVLGIQRVVYIDVVIDVFVLMKIHVLVVLCVEAYYIMRGVLSDGILGELGDVTAHILEHLGVPVVGDDVFIVMLLVTLILGEVEVSMRDLLHGNERVVLVRMKIIFDFNIALLIAEKIVYIYTLLDAGKALGVIISKGVALGIDAEQVLIIPGMQVVVTAFRGVEGFEVANGRLLRTVPDGEVVITALHFKLVIGNLIHEDYIILRLLCFHQIIEVSCLRDIIVVIPTIKVGDVSHCCVEQPKIISLLKVVPYLNKQRHFLLGQMLAEVTTKS